MALNLSTYIVHQMCKIRNTFNMLLLRRLFYDKAFSTANLYHYYKSYKIFNVNCQHDGFLSFHVLRLKMKTIFI